jgi:catalase
MADGIEAGVFFEYEFGTQVMPDDGTDSFEGIDLLDPTNLPRSTTISRRRRCSIAA